MTPSSRTGFTLVEVLVSMGLTLIVGMLLLAIYAKNQGLFLVQNAKVYQGLTVSDTMTQISELIRQSSSVAPNYPLVPPFTYTSGAETLILALPSLDGAGNSDPASSDFTVVLRDPATPNLLRLKIFPTAPSTRKPKDQVLLNNLSAVKFLYYDLNGNPVAPGVAARINFEVRVTSKAGLTDQQTSANADVVLRNN